MLPGARYTLKDVVWTLVKRSWLVILVVAVSTSVTIVWNQRLTARFGMDARRIEVVGSAIGLVLGVAFATWLERRDTSFKREDDVVRVLALPVLAAVPVVTTPLEREERRRRMVRIAMSVIALLGSMAILAWWVWRQS